MNTVDRSNSSLPSLPLEDREEQGLRTLAKLIARRIVKRRTSYHVGPDTKPGDGSKSDGAS